MALGHNKDGTVMATLCINFLVLVFFTGDAVWQD